MSFTAIRKPIKKFWRKTFRSLKYILHSPGHVFGVFLLGIKKAALFRTAILIFIVDPYFIRIIFLVAVYDPACSLYR